VLILAPHVEVEKIGGAVEISREEFEGRLAESLKNPSRIGDWGEGGALLF